MAVAESFVAPAAEEDATRVALAVPVPSVITAPVAGDSDASSPEPTEKVTISLASGWPRRDSVA